MIQEAMEAVPVSSDHDLESLFSEDEDQLEPVFGFGITFPEEEFDSDDSDSTASTHYHEMFKAAPVVPCFSTQKV